MPRRAREKCESGIYHVMVRGINRDDIFHDEEDYQRFLETLHKVKDSNTYELYAYCLMSNHIHLLLRENKDEVSKTMKRIGISYAWWYNWRYNRVGHVFQDRYRSESIDSDGQLLSVLRYIHNNPVKAILVKEAEEYSWSSCRVYYGDREYPKGLTNTELVVNLLGNNRTAAVNKLKQFTKEVNQDKYLEYEIKQRKSDEELRVNIEGMLSGKSIDTLKTIKPEKRNEILKIIKGMDGITQRQIARVTGINQSTISLA